MLCRNYRRFVRLPWFWRRHVVRLLRHVSRYFRWRDLTTRRTAWRWPRHPMQGNICERPGNWPAPRFLVRSNPAFLGIATIRLLLSAHCNCRNANSPGRTAASTCIRWPNRPAVPIARLRWGAKARPCEAVTGVKPEKDRKRESQARSRFTASLTHRVMIGRKACVVYPNRKLALIMPPFSETWPAVRLGKP